MSDGVKFVLLALSMIGNAVGVFMVYRYAYRLGRAEADMDTANAIGEFLHIHNATRTQSDEWMRGYCEASEDICDALKRS